MTISENLKRINGWNYIIEDEIKKSYFKNLEYVLGEEYKKENIYPKKLDIFKALKLTPFKDIKVVIIGQDPYHGKNQANGLAFSVQEGEPYPPSLKNIFKELKSDLGLSVKEGSSLDSWAKEGVLLLNTVLTVKEGLANSHKNIGWEKFTGFLLQKISEKKEPLVFILWGNKAQEVLKSKGKNHIIIKSSHPSPLSSYRSFFGSRPFSKANKFLEKNNIKKINWKI